MHKPRIIFFDIDGTLIDMEKKQVTPLMLDTLHRLQANGIRLAIATGRSPMTIPLWEFPGVQFDVLVTFNGAYCYDKNRVLFASPIPTEDIRTLRRALEQTTQKRGSGMILTDYPEIMKEIRGSDTLRKLWEKYSREYEYAKDISFDDTCNTIQTIMDAIMV